MPQELSITFSTGQRKYPDLSGSFSTLAAPDDAPVFSFGEVQAEGAQQISPSTQQISVSGQQFSSSGQQFSLSSTQPAKSSTLSSTDDLNVPRAAIIPPRIRPVPRDASR